MVPIGEVAMHKPLLLCVVLLLCACNSPDSIRSYSDGQAVRNMSVMVQCAALIKKLNPPTDAVSNQHYQRCLLANGAVI
jgi:hypothetical protein